VGLRDDYPDGVVFISLAALNDPSLLLPTIAHALGIQETSTRSLLARVTDALRDRRVLLVLDNFEQLVAAAAVVTAILTVCPLLSVITTSREALRVQGEHEFPLAPLPVPAVSAALDVLGGSPAVALFCQRARAVRRDFTLNAANAEAVRAICARLDGLPLAIELAAAHTRLLTPAALLQRMAAQPLALLSGGARDLPPRHRTMRDTVQWSYELLSAGEQRLFRHLTVFTGGCTLAAVEAVEASGDDTDVLDGVAALVGKSLLHTCGDDDPVRFAILETIREYGWEMLRAHDEAEALRARHAAYYLALAEEAAPALAGEAQGVWLARLEAEHDNLRAALAWAWERGDVERGLRLAGALGDFWHARGFVLEGQAWLDAMLALADVSEWRDERGVRAKALTVAGRMARVAGEYAHATAWQEEALDLQRARGDAAGIASALDELGLIAYRQGEHARATAWFEESVAFARTIGDRGRIAEALKHLGLVAWMQGEYAHAIALHEESLLHERALGNTRGIARALNNLAIIANGQGEHARAIPLHEESLTIQRAIGDRTGIALSLNNLALSALLLGDTERADNWAGESLAIRRTLGDHLMLATALLSVGNIAERRGEYDRARASLIESLTHYRILQEQSGMARSLAGLARVAAAMGEWERAVRLLAAAERQHPTPANALPDEATLRDELRATAQRTLGLAMFTAAWDAGAALSPDEAVAEATGARFPG